MSRINLYLHAARNALGRALGAGWTYTPAQKANARAMWGVFHAHGWDDDTKATCIGCAEGEASLIFPAPLGDHDQAGGAFQWHNPRRQIIKKNTGIDVWIAGPEDTARAFIWEVSNHLAAPYDKVELALIAGTSITAKMQALLAQFERSGNQARDLARRVPMANYWLTRAAQEGWSKTA